MAAFLFRAIHRSQYELLRCGCQPAKIDRSQLEDITLGQSTPLVQSIDKWNQQSTQFGPAGLEDQPRQVRHGSQLPNLTRRTILMLKQTHPEWGCQRISDLLLRRPARPASASAVARVLHEAGYEGVEVPTHSHPDKVRRFERARANEMWLM